MTEFLRVSRNSFFLACAIACAPCVAADLTKYPERPIRLIVPQAPGSSSDTIARIVATELTKQIGQQVVVDNRPGGALLIGMELTARAVPDGYTIGYAPIGALVISPNLVPKVPFDIRKDFQPIAQTANGHMLLASSQAGPLRSVRDVIEFAKQNPGKLSNASSGNGTPGHVGFELFKTMTGTQIVHVPYKGGALGIADLIANQVQLMMEGMNSITPHAKAGRVRSLAVSGVKRSDALPDVPTIAEAGVPGYAASTWNGIVAPAGVPRPIIVKLNAEINKALNSQTIRDRFAAIGAEPAPVSPEQFGAFIRSEDVKWREVVKRSGAKVD
ncbi:MAG TPA: tripartite tricarboxylate transporter substrate binding protein [Burkholderiales bacterium]|nr:tripartite tricarboxylate transporter substrate binding protein [Burkholderiales bacterium]